MECFNNLSNEFDQSKIVMGCVDRWNIEIKTLSLMEWIRKDFQRHKIAFGESVFFSIPQVFLSFLKFSLYIFKSHVYSHKVAIFCTFFFIRWFHRLIFCVNPCKAANTSHTWAELCWPTSFFHSLLDLMSLASSPGQLVEQINKKVCKEMFGWWKIKKKKKTNFNTSHFWFVYLIIEFNREFKTNT